MKFETRRYFGPDGHYVSRFFTAPTTAAARDSYGELVMEAGMDRLRGNDVRRVELHARRDAHGTTNLIDYHEWPALIDLPKGR